MIHYKGRLLSAVCGLTLSLSLGTSVLAMPVTTVANIGSNPNLISAPVEGKQPTEVAEAAKIPQEEAIKIAQAVFSIPQEFGTPSVYYYSSKDTASLVQTYHLSWTNPNKLSSIREDYNVEIDASTGFVRSFNHYRYDPTNPGAMPKYRYEEAKPIAQGWIEKIQPKLAKQLRLDPSPMDELQDMNSLSFRWYRVENDVIFIDDFMMITINPQDGSLQNYHSNWSDHLIFPTTEKAMNQASAQAAYDHEFAAHLTYNRFYQPAGQSSMRLVYQVETKLIDAETGKPLNSEGQEWKNAKAVELPTSEKQLVRRSSPMNQEEALAVARALLGDLAAGAPNNASFSTESTSVKSPGAKDELVSVWHFNWSLGDKDPINSYLYATVDADYGVIRDFSLDGVWKSDAEIKEQTPVDEAVARQCAIELLAKARPDLLRQVRLLDRSVLWAGAMGVGMDVPVQREYTFNFERIAHGIPVSGEQVSIMVDRYSGQVRNMWINWSQEMPKLPSSKEMQTDTAIKVISTQETPVVKQYRKVWSADHQQSEVKLVYAPMASIIPLYDAVTGHRLDWSGRDLFEARKPIADINDHPYKTEIETMIYRQVFEVTDGKFNPQGTLNRGEVAKALVIALGQGDIAMKFAMETIRANQAPSYGDVDYDNPFYCYIEQAVRSGILQPSEPNDQFNIDSLVSNEEFALWVARAMGYGEIAKMKPAIEISYSDQLEISASNRNAVGVLIGLEVLDGKGDFKPAVEVTRAGVARILYIAAQKTPRNRIFY